VSRYSQEEIIDGVRRRDNRILKYIYKHYYTAIFKFILTNSGNEDDAKDIFQETIIVAFHNIRKNKKFKLESSFQTYLYSIARLLWLKSLRNKSNEDQLKENNPFIEFEEPMPFNEEDLRYAAYQRAFSKLPEDCQQIIRMVNDGISQKEIADKLGFKSENYIWKRKHYCKEYLIARVKEDPEYQQNK
jgi:RNA polymerase sigma factor (sigma-70 family)